MQSYYHFRKENNGGEGIPLPSIINVPGSTSKLHQLSRTLSTTIGDLEDLGKRLVFLIESAERCKSALRHTRCRSKMPRLGCQSTSYHITVIGKDGSRYTTNVQSLYFFSIALQETVGLISILPI